MLLVSLLGDQGLSVLSVRSRLDLLGVLSSTWNTFCSSSLPWAAKRFLSGVKKHLPALLEVLKEQGKLMGYILMDAEHLHLPEHQPPPTASVRSSPE